MIDRSTRLRLRRSLRHKRKSLEAASEQAGHHVYRHVFRRWHNLAEVRRFVVGWLLLVILLGSGVLIQTYNLRAYYLTEVPAAGGVFREGVVGEITNMNPIFATSPADQSAAQLMFSRLLKYDAEGHLIGDLAESWKVSESGRLYTVRLRRNLKWHDGTPFTAKDVVFTYRAIQHPDTRPSLNASWRDIQVSVRNKHTIRFLLPNPFTPFPHSLTRGGILPAHILQNIEPAQLRGHPFNVQDPIGTGPFKFGELVELGKLKQLSLDAYEGYHLGKPKLENFVLRTFDDHEKMIQAFTDGELTAIAGLRTLHRPQLAEVSDVIWHDMPLNNAVYLFLRGRDELLEDKLLRLALLRATNRNAILELLEARYVAAKGPLLQHQRGYDEKLVQYPYNPSKARALFRQAGWKLNSKGQLRRGGKPLELSLVTQNSDDYPAVAEALQDQWAKFGVKLNVSLVSDEEIQQSYIVPHNYQALLYGVTIGADPDVFAYWHSTQSRAGGFNLSEYRSDIADIALEAGRTRPNGKLRAAKYRTFLRQWRKDAPAIAIYQPGFAYVQHIQVSGFQSRRLSSPEERLQGAYVWQIATQPGEKPY